MADKKPCHTKDDKKSEPPTKPESGTSDNKEKIKEKAAEVKEKVKERMVEASKDLKQQAQQASVVVAHAVKETAGPFIEEAKKAAKEAKKGMKKMASEAQDAAAVRGADAKAALGKVLEPEASPSTTSDVRHIATDIVSGVKSTAAAPHAAEEAHAEEAAAVKAVKGKEDE